MTVTNLTPPTISGTVRKGAVLQANPGTWDYDLDEIDYEYQWERCDSMGASCIDIGGATSQSYIPVNADVGSTLRVRVHGVESASPPPPPPLPGNAYWVGDFADDAQDFSDFDTHDVHFTTFTDPTVGSTKDAVIIAKPVADSYPQSDYVCRLIANNDLPSNSASGQTVNLWEPGAYGQPWIRGNEVWCRVLALIPDDSDPDWPGACTPIPGDGVSSSWHVISEWHKNDGAGAPGPTSSKLELAVYGGQPVWIFKPIGGLYGAVHGKYLYETDQVQDENNGAGGSTGPIGGSIIPLDFNRMYDHLFRWKLDPDPTVGEIDWYVDGVLRVSGNFGNMFRKADGSTPGLSFQAGMYRNYPTWAGNVTATTDENEHVYIGAMLAGPTRASVGA